MAAFDLAPGSMFGRYEIQKELGRGGMGMVYRARDTMLDRVVALKVLGEQLSSSEEFVARFSREARAAARLNHTNIVHVYDLGDVGGRLYIAMEFVEGRTLGAYLKPNERFREAQALVLVKEAARALAVAHEAGLVHRDVKPENIMVTTQGVVKLVDLGLAKEIMSAEEAQHTQTGHTLGTPAYAAPEQIWGRKDIDGRADIYSLGATLFHLVTGRPPFQAVTSAIVTMKHLSEPVPDPRTVVPELSEGLHVLISTMMAKERDERPPNALALIDDISLVQRGQLPAPRDAGGWSPAETYDGPAVPDPVHAPAPTLDSGQLRSLEEALASAIGPMAKVLVRKRAAAGLSIEALCDDLAEQIPTEPERREFLKRVAFFTQAQTAFTPPPMTPTGERSALRTGLRTAVSQKTTVPQMDARPASQATDAQLAALERALANYIGPLARVIVKKNFRMTPGLETLVSKLAAQIESETDRQKFLNDVKNLT
ncbi:MAG: serine/threonine protein kinase [Acidobacteria bacterium]|nr:serine/threonine protein kinase [Acidobacteriota bacterium]